MGSRSPPRFGMEEPTVFVPERVPEASRDAEAEAGFMVEDWA